MTTTGTINGQRFRYIGVTDECIECQQCGKADLRSTVLLGILDADGNVEAVTYYGSTCAARALGVRGGGRKVLEQARAADRETRQNAEHGRQLLAEYGADEHGRWATRGLFERAVTHFWSKHQRSTVIWNKTRADLARDTFELIQHWATHVAAGALIGA